MSRYHQALTRPPRALPTSTAVLMAVCVGLLVTLLFVEALGY